MVTGSQSPIYSLVEEYLESKGIAVRYPGVLVRENSLTAAETTVELGEVIRQKPLDPGQLLTAIVQHGKARGLPLTKAETAAVMKMVVEDHAYARKAEIALPLFEPLEPNEEERASACWQLLGSLFAMDPDIAVAVLKHFVWSVKRKISRNPVTDHCMPIIFSAVQGSGKTTLVRNLLAPLQELATEPSLLSELSDPRSADLFRFSVVWLDDMEPIGRDKVPVLKSLITATAVRRRKLMTSATVRIENEFIPIGTSNVPVSQLVPDATGHRRFAMLPLRVNNEDRCADPSVWEIVNDIDYALLWRSVAVLPKSNASISPIKSQLSALRRHQQNNSHPGMMNWIETLAITQNEALMNASSPSGISATALHRDFQRVTGEIVSPFRFKRLMDDFTTHPSSPFLGRKRHAGDVRYELKTAEASDIAE